MCTVCSNKWLSVVIHSLVLSRHKHNIYTSCIPPIRILTLCTQCAEHIYREKEGDKERKQWTGFESRIVIYLFLLSHWVSYICILRLTPSLHVNVRFIFICWINWYVPALTYIGSAETNERGNACGCHNSLSIPIRFTIDICT